MSAQRVAVLAGGRSSEHEVSLSSAAAVAGGLRTAGHEVVAVEIGRDGAWTEGERRLSVTPGAGLLEADVVFPVLHGPFGEDGSVQGLLEMLDVPYVGAGVEASALCMDKVIFKDLMSAAGVPQVGYAGIRAARWAGEQEAVLTGLERLGLPVFVKPARLGSSVGIARAATRAELESALHEAFAHDSLAIVEQAAAGKEVECGVLGSFASQPGEIVYANEFYDYEAKYTPGGMELLIPPRISERALARVRELALSTFELVDCDGLARVDFFVDGEEVLVNELNTMPGFTPTSVYAKLMEASGVPYPELVDRLCRLALERHLRARALSH